MAHPAGAEAQDRLLSPGRDGDLGALAARLQELALQRALTVATAESCTGGLVGHAITEIAGSSGYYVGGIVAYADRVKVSQLAVPPETIEHHGAVSAQVAVAMAEGARAALSGDVAVAVTGVAGPAGGTEAKPVGLTYVATASEHGHEVQRYVWAGDRAANKADSAAAALRMLITAIEGLPGTGVGA